MEAWIESELETVAMGDERLHKRLALLLERLSASPERSIPTACKGLAEVMAAYRFFDNAKATVETVLAPHRDATIRRMAGHDVVLLVQDTTELDYSGHEATEGLGPLNYEARVGLLKHLTLAVTAERLCLGVVEAKIWGREERRACDREAIRRLPIEEKESYRWVESWRRACEISERVPETVVVSVSDRESDIYEYLREAQEARARGVRAHWLVRSGPDRCLEDGDETAEACEKLRAHLQSMPTLGRVDVMVARSRGRKKRRATVRLKSATVRLRAPFRYGGQQEEVEVNAVWVEEVHPPKRCEPLQWLLLTSLPVATFADAVTVMDYYCCRWQIEIFFKVLKQGCRIEKLQLETDARLKAAIAVYLIVAWRVLFVSMLGRHGPQLPCTVIFEDDEWKAVWTVCRRTALPKQPPTLGQMVRMVAGLGGWLGRKHDGPPGPQTLWIGLQRTKDFACAWRAFGPSARRRDV